MGKRWTSHEEAKLTLLWADPSLTTFEISEHFPGRTRNSIIGKAHKVGLPERKKGKPSMFVESDNATEEPSIANGKIRKAYASKGDDVTLSRFVKIDKSPITPKPRQPHFQGFGNASAEAGRSYFYRKGLSKPDEHKHVLKSGHGNVKIGRDVRKGKLKGYWIYTLSLEERATCPRSCKHWYDCYGNNMPYSTRIDHRDARALERKIEADIEALLSVRGRVGILVRLHALGDFFDQDYVDFWGNMLAKFDRLSVYGYTAHPIWSALGQRIDEVRSRHGFNRFAIRHSDGGLSDKCTISIYDLTTPSNAFICPEQTAKTAACATCALCWSTQKNVAFINH